jgi:hypothetical protein
MVGVVDEVEIVGVDVKLSGAAVALLRCMGEVTVMLGASGGCWLSRSEGRIIRVRNSWRVVAEVDRSRLGEKQVMNVQHSVYKGVPRCWGPVAVIGRWLIKPGLSGTGMMEV